MSRKRAAGTPFQGWERRVRATLSLDCSDAVSTNSLLSTSTYQTRIDPSSRRSRAASTVDPACIVCAVSESRGLSPTVGLAALNIRTGEAVFCQLSDSQTYVKTLSKLLLFQPTEVLVLDSAAADFAPPTTLLQIIQNHLPDIGSSVTKIDRKHWTENKGLEYIHRLALDEDVQELETASSNRYYAICSLAAVFHYVEDCCNILIAPKSIWFKCGSPDGTMTIDISTIRNLELIQNLYDQKAKTCLFGHMDQTQTPMGSRMLRSSILQPLTDEAVIQSRLDALEELSSSEQLFCSVRGALEEFIDCEKLLTWFVAASRLQELATHTNTYKEQSINQVLAVRSFLKAILNIHSALEACESNLLGYISEHCRPGSIEEIQDIIESVLEPDARFASKPIELKYQRIYAVKASSDDILGITRQVYRELQQEMQDYVSSLEATFGFPVNYRCDERGQYRLIFPKPQIQTTGLHPDVISHSEKKNRIEGQTLRLIQYNNQLSETYLEIILRCDSIVQSTIQKICPYISSLFKICESIALLDMLCSFAEVSTTYDYRRPEFADKLALQAVRHPIHEKEKNVSFVPNDVYASESSRFQIITGINMSGKSTYIRTIALVQVMAQMGCFVPARLACVSIRSQLFARICTDDNVESNLSTFGAEMSEIAFILRNVDEKAMIIIDELGRGTSTKDGLAITIAISEALIDFKCYVWFVTHFHDLASIFSHRRGVATLKLKVDMTDPSKIRMLYKVANGETKEKQYGLQMARIVNLPTEVLETGEEVAASLAAQTENSRSSSGEQIQARRRTMILALQEQLSDMTFGQIDGAPLLAWLTVLQREFIQQMKGGRPE